MTCVTAEEIALEDHQGVLQETLADNVRKTMELESARVPMELFAQMITCSAMELNSASLVSVPATILLVLTAQIYAMK
jgi:hypothetical protein